MNEKIKTAIELIKIAEQIIAYPTDTYENFDEYAKDYQKKYHERPDEKLWDLFDTQEEVEAFIQNKSKSFPHLKQIISEQTIKRLLDNDWFIIVSAGRNADEIKDKALISDKQIKERYDELRKFLQSLNVPYYEVIGQYGGSSQLSYIVDLSNNGVNDETTIKSNLRKIRSFCGNELNQDAVIEGYGKQRVYMYTREQPQYHVKTKQVNPIEKNENGRSQVFNDYKDRKNNTTWSDEYDFNRKNQGDWIK